MAAPPPLNLRRLPLKRSALSGRRPENVFAAARLLEPVRPLVVAFHASGLKAHPKKKSRVLIRRELRYAHNNVLVLVQPEGPVSEDMAGRGGNVKIRSLRERWLDSEETPDCEMSWILEGRAGYASLTQELGSPPERVLSFLEAEALATYGADMIITEDREFLAHRDDPAWAEAVERGERPPADQERLDTYLGLYRKTKSDRMLRSVTSKKFEPRATQGASIELLNSLRNEFMHFLPKSWSLEVSGLPAVCSDCLDLVEFLAWECGNVSWDNPMLEARARRAMRAARRSLLAMHSN